GLAGTLAAGAVAVGDEVLVAASRKPARISRIVTMDGELESAIAGQAVTLVLDRELDISRGDVLVHPGAVPEYSNQFQARLVWMQEEPAFPGRSYLLKVGAQFVPASITDLKFRTNVNTLEKSPAKSLELNEVGTVTIATGKPISLFPTATHAPPGKFILIAWLPNPTLGSRLTIYRPRTTPN